MSPCANQSPGRGPMGKRPDSGFGVRLGLRIGFRGPGATALARGFILMFGLVNASLYAALLPLWEGFDEAFHYGYIESLWQTHQLPALGRTLVPIDVFRSFHLAPVSHIVNRWFPETISFE